MTGTVAAALIVKNESEVIERCLDSANNLVDSFVVIDTGSTDNTQSVIDAWCNRNEKPLHLIGDGWVSFSYNRQKLFDLARTKADWVLLLDADMTVDGYPQMPDQAQVGMCPFIVGEIVNRLPLLVKSECDAVYRGDIHEYLDVNAYVKANVEGFAVIHHGGGGSTRTLADDIATFREDQKANPDNPRTMYYLARALAANGETEEAIDLYLKRSTYPDFEEEAWHAEVKAGELLIDSDWDRGASMLVHAWERRPWRAEPLYFLSYQARIRDKHYAALMYAQQAAQIRFPKTDLLFIEHEVYGYKALFELSMALANTGKFEAAQMANETLRNHPLPEDYRAHVEHNVEYVRSQLKGGE